MKQSELLTEFYRSYLAWAIRGPDAQVQYNERRGLCDGLYQFVHHKKFSRTEEHLLLKEMRDQFEAEGLNWDVPFNHGPFNYRQEIDKRWNPKRMNWVRKHAEPQQPCINIKEPS